MNLVVAPYIMLLGSAVVCLVAWGRPKLQFWATIIGHIGLIISSLELFRVVYENGPQVINIGRWPAPFGVTFVTDLFSCLMLLIGGFIGLSIQIFAISGLSNAHKKQGFYFLSNTMLFGVCAAFSTGDIFNLYVCYELMLISSFVLLSLGRTKAQLEASIKYVLINFLGSIIFLIAVALIYAGMGSLNMAHLGFLVQQAPISDVSLAGAFLLMIAFAIKAGLFPLFFWLPASYHTPPTVVTAFFAGLLTKVGIYSLLRVYSVVFPLAKLPEIAHVLWLMAILTMIIGVIGAVSKFTMKKILAVHIISQVGYMALGLALFTPKALTAAVFYLLHNIVAKTNLFFIAGISEKLLGSDDLSKTGGLLKRAPLLGIFFLISALGLAGIPPLSGFFAKLFIAQAAVDLEDWFALTSIFGVSVLTTFSMLKIWNEAFWREERGEIAKLDLKTKLSLYTPTAFLALVVVMMGIWSTPLYDLCYEVAAQLFHPDMYIQSVLAEPHL